MKFVCPKCGAPFIICENGSVKCKENHTYDRARAGYYNLMLSASGGTHGDNAEMLEARRDFLDTGAYLPLAERISEIVAELAAEIGRADVLDIGCGEGFYTNLIEKGLANAEISHTVSGFDISRDAVKFAAKRNKSISLAVATAYHMPVADGAFDIAVNMFSPLAADEVLRALCYGGYFVMAIPAEEHLFALKKVLYKTPYKNEVSDSAISGFELVKTERVSYIMNLEKPSDIWSLFKMTPYAYRTKPADAERIKELSSLACEANFVIFVYKKV